jgi:hypothetical protein
MAKIVKDMTQDQSLREHLIYLLDGGGAHLKWELLVKDFDKCDRPATDSCPQRQTSKWIRKHCGVSEE